MACVVWVNVTRQRPQRRTILTVMVKREAVNDHEENWVMGNAAGTLSCAACAQRTDLPVYRIFFNASTT